jgi:hypothetical protein
VLDTQINPTFIPLRIRRNGQWPYSLKFRAFR